MFDRNSRYAKQPTYLTMTPGGQQVAAVSIPLPRTEVPAGLHRKVEGDRLDLLAARYLNDPTAFWRLCDLNGNTVPAALEGHPLIAIPKGGPK
jgi:hypothetical protein